MVMGILKMTGLVAGVAASIALAVPIFKPTWFTPDPAVAALMAKAAPFAALGMLMHPSVRG
jgi:Na+-driven multidrug efflux pump